jgi:hypothetical protein
MDNLFTKEYILKCSNNPDLQSLWEEPKEGQIVLIDEELCYINEVLSAQFLPEYKNDCIYVPRQDELQIILKQKIDRFNNMTDLKFDFNMRQCIFKTYCTKILNLLTLNDMWLIFFMRELFGKQWVPESKSWQVR